MPGYRPGREKQQKKCFRPIRSGYSRHSDIAYIIGGLFSGFGKSPSSFTPLGISENIFYVGTMLIGWIESRLLVTRFGKKNTFPDSIVGNSALYFPINSFAAAYGVPTQDYFEQSVISSWLPLLAEKPEQLRY